MSCRAIHTNKLDRQMTFTISPKRRSTLRAVSLVALMLGLVSYQPAFAQEAVVILNGETQTETVVLDEDGDSLTINAGGAIAVEDEDGVSSVADDVTVTNDGKITATGFDAGGIISRGENAINTNNGSITTTGGQGDGIVSTAGTATNTNTGTISTDGLDADGILSFGPDAVNTNSGTIDTVQNGSGGIFSRGANTTNTNSGNFTSQGAESDGIVSVGANSVNTNSGSMQTAGFDSDGIFSIGRNAQNINAGDIVTTGEAASGIFSSGSNALNTNSGTIKTSGLAAHGIVVSGGGSTLTNTGLVSAIGENSNAIQGGSGSQTVNLGEGSLIIGRFDLGSGSDTVNFDNSGAGLSAVITLERVETVNIIGDDRPLFFTDDWSDVITVVDTTGFSVLNDATGLLADTAQRTVGQQAGGDGAWASLVGASRGRDDDGTTLAYRSGFAGVMAGYETGLGGSRLGFVGGVSTGETATDIASVEITSQSVFGGAYLGTSLGSIDLTSSLLAGIESHDSDRLVADNVAGFETATATIDSSFVSAGLQAKGGGFSLGGTQFVPSASANYTFASYEGYSETGTTNANLDVGSRTAQSLNGRVQLETLSTMGALETAFRFGIDGRVTDAEDVTITLGDDTQSFAETDSDTTFGGFLGARAVFAQTDAMQVSGDVEFGFGQEGENAVTGGLNVSFSF